MRKITLAFVPGASPTCIPLGVASLAGFLKKERPALEVTTVDLSIRFWERLLQADGQGARLLAFFHGADGNFFEEDAYTEAWRELTPYHQRWQALTLEIDYALKNGETLTDSWYGEVLFETLCLAPDHILLLSAAYPNQLLHAAMVAILVKRRFPGVTVLLGGSALPSIDPESLLLAVPEIDRVYLGEGEEGVLDYLSDRSGDGRGWMYLEGTQTILAKRPRAIPMHRIPTPLFEGLDVTRRLMPTPVLPVAFSRGCRWRKCAFCSHNFGFAGYRTNDVFHFVDQLAQLQQTYGTGYFYFVDQYIDAHSLDGIASEIIRQQLQIRFHVMGRPTSDYTPALFQKLYASGCRWISWGVESGAQALLDGCNKGTSAAAVATVLKDCHGAGINNLAMMVFGLPGTTPSLFQETLDFSNDVSDCTHAFTDSSFQLFENTPYHKNASIHGIDPAENEILFAVGAKQVISLRRAYVLRREDGIAAVRPGPDEVALWKRWKCWVRGDVFFETLPAEHYLLFADHLSAHPLNAVAPF
ncbi:MAG: radical SAM protein [Deltaproteobacteria bacterium]|nr:radical SAM protein [Deltaproteobacteria bacterium]